MTNKANIDRLARVYVEPTNRCNLDCRTCMRQGWEEGLGFMDFAMYEKILAGWRAFPDRFEIFLGGFGEPLSHPRIADMVALAKSAGSRVELISNGILLDDAMSRRLIAAGLDRIWISIDGASQASYADVRLGDHLPEIIANLERLNARSNKPELGISFVAMKRNLADLPAVIDLARRLGASRFSLSNVEPYTEDMVTEVLYGQVLFEALPEGGCIMPRFDLNSIEGETLEKVSALFPDALTFTPLNPDHEGLCPFLRRRSASVRWDGQIGPCLPLLHAHTVCLNGHSRNWEEFHLGSLADRALADIWNDAAYRDFRHRLDEFSFAPCSTCNSCDLPSVNGEDCFGNIHPACGGCLWSQGFIQCP
ncbi:MAG: radical SAM protein [Candidatus Aminicenantes bacterium]|nr:radical SAM protein [Candidatus Aminicenantes bacterium]